MQIYIGVSVEESRLAIHTVLQIIISEWQITMKVKQLLPGQQHHCQPSTSPFRTPVYDVLLRAGPRLKPLQQVHAHLIVSASHRFRSLLTKLITLACTATASYGGSISYVRQLFAAVPDPDSFLFNSLITHSSKFGFPKDSLFYYRQMLLSDATPSNYSFTSVIKSCADLSALRLGTAVHAHVLSSGFGSDVYVQAALVALYSKCGDLRVAREVFEKMPERSIVAWNTMISGYEQHGFANEAIEVFHQMRHNGPEPDSATFVGLLGACAHIGALSLGSWVHEYLKSHGLHVNVLVGTCLINMYSRCGSVNKAREVFDSITEKNVIAWTAMISSYGTNGHGIQAIELFNLMKTQGPRPNKVTFVAILTACAHSGLVDTGQLLYSSMSNDYGLNPGVEHYVCMVDMLGRAGLLKEAYKFIMEQIPSNPPPAVWTAMLGACKMHKKLDLGVEIAEHLLHTDATNPGHYVMLSNIYALAGRRDRVEMVRNLMIRKGLKKQVGYSTIEIDQKTFLFSIGDKSHPETHEIYRYLDELMLRCVEAGYLPLVDSFMHELEGEEREYALRFHSEKLALAFGLMKTRDGVVIRIVKNLRMCEDCHLVIKFVSRVANREIVVRDKLRFHHFKDGSCSCMDFW